jgi:crotonobetainyl-CoA:carnitine CoA-transferase CaiB-like acyl-CoA transferase
MAVSRFNLWEGTMAGALSGIRIVDLTNIILGPYGTMLLADQGADVIKVEAPEGDAVRHIGKPARTPGMGPTYLYVNRNKRSLCLDLKQPAARAALLKVVATADAFVHALRPQAIEALGLGYEEIRKVRPDIVYVGAYGYSADGPYGKLPAYDDAIQARFGIASLMGQAAGDDVPRYPPTIIADKTVGLTFAFSTLSALMHRQRTGEGQFVEVPMFETMAAWLMVEHLWERTFDDEGTVGYTRLLARTRKPYRTRDGWMAILPYNDKHWRNFFELVGKAEVLQDPRYSTINARSLHIGDMYEMVEALAVTRTTAEWVRLLDEAQIPNAPVSRPADLFDDPHLVWRKLFAKYPHPSEGEITMVEPPMRMSRTPPEIRRMAPRQGADSRAVLAEAGVDAAAIEALKAAGALIEPD